MPIIRPPFRLLRTRREIWGLERTNTWDPITLAYAKAIQELQGRPATNRTNYQYQTNIHGTSSGSGTGPDGIWNACQHGTWFFFPWHRMYILQFELIVKKVVTAQGGPANWALPYWDWQCNRALPPAFREPNLPASAGGGPNPLFIANRQSSDDPNFSVNSGLPMARAVVDSSTADSTVVFSGGSATAFGFGGGVIDRPSHFGAGMTGRLEQQPHNIIHRTVGGPMATAASPTDPIFWLHHAQVDRLWVRWLALGGGRGNPTDNRWLDQQFQLADADANLITMTPRNVRSPSALGYRYEDDPPTVRLPISALVPEQAAVALRGLEAMSVTSPEPQQLGISGPLDLGKDATSTTIELEQKPDADLAMLAVPETAPSTVALVIDDITLDDPLAPSYEVYLNLDDVGEGGDHSSPYFVGFLEFFGVDHEHADEGERAEGSGHSGPSRAFEITSLVHHLEQEGQWDPARVKVSFVPARVFEDPETGEPMPPAIERDPGVHVGAVRVVAE
jgi:hypothetical protein